MPATTIAAIERILDFRASPERLWRALTDSAEIAQWFGQRAALDLRPGGDAWFEWDGHGRAHARVEEVEARRRLAWRWARDPGTPIGDGPDTLVEFRLEPLPGGGTRLHLRESGFERPEDRAENSWGWQDELADLAGFVAAAPWEAGLRRSYRLRSSVDRVWRAFSDPAQLAAWWSGNPDLDVRAGIEGWWSWPRHGGRFAMRFEAVEPPRYLCWSWCTTADVPLAEAEQVLRTEWTLVAREDGGTDVHLFESGFVGPKDFELNGSGWDGDVVPGLRRHLDEG